MADVDPRKTFVINTVLDAAAAAASRVRLLSPLHNGTLKPREETTHMRLFGYDEKAHSLSTFLLATLYR